MSTWLEHQLPGNSSFNILLWLWLAAYVILFGSENGGEIENHMKYETDKVAKKTEQLMKLGLVAGAAILPRYELTSPNALTATKNHPEEYATIGICNLCTCPLLWLEFYLANLQLVLVA